MKIKQLKQLISHLDDEDNVRILVERGYMSVGPRHTTGVKQAYPGIDWESRMLLIEADEPVYAGLEQMKKASRFSSRVREILWARRNLDHTRQKNANTIRQIEEELDKWIPNRPEQ